MTTETLLTFDGVILEIFGPIQVLGVSQLNVRFHRDLMRITIEGPDRKGSHKVAIAAGAPGPYEFVLGPEDVPVIEFLERVRTALPTA